MSQDYTPKYTSLDEIPIQIPDDYSYKEKRDALEFAEAIIEIDLNDGERIPEEEFTYLYEAALKQKATCELAKGSEHPDDTALGDLEDTGSTKVDYATDAFCQRYQELIDKIRDSGGDDGVGDGYPDEYVYTTSAPESGWQESDVYDNL